MEKQRGGISQGCISRPSADRVPTADLSRHVCSTRPPATVNRLQERAIIVSSKTQHLHQERARRIPYKSCDTSSNGQPLDPIMSDTKGIKKLQDLLKSNRSIAGRCCRYVNHPHVSWQATGQVLWEGVGEGTPQN
ncbi:hypothetical protein J6590_047665 [Homalodisca vitripennis]|nr:hypothetical protein J6590_047665 [Homalodisca vitripennis]